MSCAAAMAIAALPGCGGTGDDATAVDAADSAAMPTESIRLLVIDDPALADALQREWQGYSKTPLAITQQTTQQLEQQHVAERKPLAADAVVYPAGLIGALADAGLISPLPDSVVDSKALDRPDILALARLHEAMWGEQVYAIPFGSPQLVLMYRSDLLELLDVAPPATWAEYQTLAQQLAERENLGDKAPAEGAWHAVAEPLGPGWASQMLLARAGGYARRRNRYSTLFDYNTMAPQIGEPPFVRALEELVAAAKLGPEQAGAMTPHDARRELLAGRAALAVCWPTNAPVAGQEPFDEPVRFPVRFAELPGSPEVFEPGLGWEQRTAEEDPRVPLLSTAGRLGSVALGSPRSRSAAGVLAWLARRRSVAGVGQNAGPISAATSMYRSSQLQHAPLWVDSVLNEAAARSYASVVAQTHTRPTPLFSVRIPGRDRYLAALDEAVQSAIEGKQQPGDALSAAAAKWSEITKQIGVERQRIAYFRSLGLEP
jgi:multiple sugar transport system substrate-binding protein